MADTYQHIDLTTLQRIEQLLTTADLGPADERARGPVQASASVGAGAPSADHAGTTGDVLAPLPRRH